MKVTDISGETFYVLSVKTCKNNHTFLGQPNLEEKCEDCGERLE